MSYNDTTDYDGCYLFGYLSKDPEVVAAMGLEPGVCYSHAPGFNEIRAAIKTTGENSLVQAKIYLRCKAEGREYIPLRWHNVETEEEYDRRIQDEADLPRRIAESRRFREESIRLFKAVYSARIK